jgi:hypothetical protein
MHTLPLEWSRGSWTYTQVSREGDVALYRQTHREGSAVRFEVIIVQHAKERLAPGGKVVEAGEYYPSSSQWGKGGWTCYTLEEAHALTRDLACACQPSAGDWSAEAELEDTP